MDEKHRNVMDEKRLNVMDEKRLFYGKKNSKPFNDSSTNLWYNTRGTFFTNNGFTLMKSKLSNKYNILNSRTNRTAIEQPTIREQPTYFNARESILPKMPDTPSKQAMKQEINHLHKVDHHHHLHHQNK
jgi:hypothetical protein